MPIREDRAGALRRVTLAHEGLVVEILPELGGKLSALRRAASGRNALLEPPEPERPWRAATHGASFADHDTSGYDDCFPTVAACASPDEPGLALPDHGDLWSAPWAIERDGDALCLAARARSVPCRLARRLAVRGETLRLDYELTSEADRPLSVLWSAHPLLAASPGSRLHLPAAVRQVVVEWSAGDRLGTRGARRAWGPDLAVLGPRDAGRAEKLFTDRLPATAGACALHDRASDESVILRFDPARLPWLGLWICQGGWPTHRAAKHYTVALEPCAGRPDSLAEAARAGECLRLGPRQTVTWTLEIEVRAGAPALEATT